MAATGIHRWRRRRGPRARSVPARKIEVYRPGRVPPAAWVHPLLTFFVSEDERDSTGVPQLRALFTLLDSVGAAEVHQRTAAHTSWRLLEAAEPRVVLRLEISEPADARGVLDLMMDAGDYREAWQLIQGGHWIGITTGDRLRPHEDGTGTALDEAFAACIPLSTTPPPALAEMAHAAR